MNLERRIAYVLAVSVLLLCAVGGYFLFSRTDTLSARSPDVFADTATTSAALSSGTMAQPAGTEAYMSNAYHFSLFYPDDLSVSEKELSGSSEVILFQDEADQQGFQIFVTPYAGEKITEQRFEMDEPSGVMEDPQNVTIDGAAATEFISSNSAMGASREIWFLHGGYLYEVTAPQSLDSWLLQIMETWQFTR
jgi:hypothetical protein